VRLFSQEFVHWCYARGIFCLILYYYLLEIVFFICLLIFISSEICCMFWVLFISSSSLWILLFFANLERLMENFPLCNVFCAGPFLLQYADVNFQIHFSVWSQVWIWDKLGHSESTKYVIWNHSEGHYLWYQYVLNSLKAWI